MRRKLQNISLKLLLSCSLIFFSFAAQAQVTANCVNNFNLTLDFFGVDTLLPQNINAGSTNADSFLINGQPFIAYSCSDIGPQTITLTAINSTTGQTDVCSTTITVSDQIAPQAVCLSNLTIALDSFGNGVLMANMLDPNSASYDACGIVSYTINGQASISLSCADTGTNVVTALLTDAAGNSSTCATNVTVSDPGICAAGPLNPTIDTIINSRCDTNNCTGVINLDVQGGWAPYQISWSDGVSGTALLRTAVCPGSYAVTVTDVLGTVVTLGPFDVETFPGCVWPGDTDDNHRADNFDLLPVALAHGTNGLTRPNATIQWQGESSPDWQISTNIIDLPDWKHIDANGDAQIDTNDLIAINQNYNQQYYPVVPTILSPLGLVPFYTDTVQVDEGQMVSIPINLGTSLIPADSVYALAFSIVYDSSLVEPGTAYIEFKNSWMGGDLLTLAKDFPFNGRMELALGRKDQQPVSGYGMIASINFTIRDDVFRAPTSRSMPIILESIRLVDELNNLLPVQPIEGELVINEVTSITNVANKETALSVFPNPADQLLNIELSNAEIEEIRIFNMAGQEIFMEANPRMLINQIDVSSWTAGVYAVQVKTRETVLHKTVWIR
jgi:hypothetical protein